MQRFTLSPRILLSLIVLAGLLVATVSTYTVMTHVEAASDPLVALPGSYTAAPMNANVVGHHADSASLSVFLVLQPRNANQLHTLLNDLYNPKSSRYHHWLAKGEYDRLFAPSAASVEKVRAYLRKSGLTIDASPSPFIVRASGSTSHIETAFKTTINDYHAVTGETFYQNTTALSLPASLSSIVQGVSGTYNTVRLHSQYIRTSDAAQRAERAVPQYGAGPNGSGLTPSQTTSLYGANEIYKLGDRGQGEGATLAVFELSGYTPADVTAYENQFFGASEQVHVIDVNVDGGPVTPKCPSGDQCGPFGAAPCTQGCDSADYSGDVEVEADIEQQIALAPKINSILVYNAPNDATGTTTLDEEFKIANDDLADSISSSWGLCEQDAGLAFAQAEYPAFQQMAMQGQSFFSAAGDTGAYDCLRGSGSTKTTVDDPTSQPYVTGVGGTSFGTYDPGSTLYPTYPKGFETVWNPLNMCSGSTNGLKACGNFGAGGGGVSSFWAMPSYQSGAGVLSSYSQKSPYCSQATSGQYCREVPDVSADADEFTPYAEYCTGDPKTNSACASSPGWFGIGGTSLASPLWSGVIALWDSVHHARFGNANSELYELFNSDDAYSSYFHDITGVHQNVNNNGYYPTTPNYDMATGIGTPRISGIARADV